QATNISIVCCAILGVWRASLLKREVAKRICLDVAALPYNEELLHFLRNEHKRGRRLVLATAADEIVAHHIADYLGIFSEVLASNGRQNLKGAAKCKELQLRFGDEGFDYAGNQRCDVKVWEHSRAAILVNPSNRVIGQ